jgi:hypothetical protein
VKNREEMVKKTIDEGRNGHIAHFKTDHVRTGISNRPDARHFRQTVRTGINHCPDARHLRRHAPHSRPSGQMVTTVRTRVI